jgi:hypothetical protein
MEIRFLLFVICCLDILTLSRVSDTQELSILDLEISIGPDAGCASVLASSSDACVNSHLLRQTPCALRHFGTPAGSTSIPKLLQSCCTIFWAYEPRGTHMTKSDVVNRNELPFFIKVVWITTPRIISAADSSDGAAQIRLLFGQYSSVALQRTSFCPTRMEACKAH